MRPGRYWMLLSRFLMIAASWSTSVTQRLLRLFFMFAQAPSRCTAHPVRAHNWEYVARHIFPDENHGSVQQVVRGGDQVSVVGFGHRAALALAATVGVDLVEQAAARAGLVAGQSRDRDPA